MSGPKQITPLRFCLSCCNAVLCWALWLTLTGTMATLGYVAYVKELPVPEFVLRRAERELVAANIDVSFGRARFDLTGRILLEDVRLRSQQFQEPLLASRLVYLDLNFWSLLAGHTNPKEIRVEGALLQLPAMLSPSGAAEPLVRNLAATVRYENGQWQISQLAGLVNHATVTVRGTYTPQRRPPNVPRLTIEEVTSRFLQVGRQLALAVHELDVCEQPALDLTLATMPGIGNTADLSLTIRRVRATGTPTSTVENLSATTTIRLDGDQALPLRLHATADRIDFGGKYSAAKVRGIFSAQISPDRRAIKFGQVQLAAQSVTAFGETAFAPVLQTSLDRWPEVNASAALQVDGAWLTAEIEAQLRTGVARIHGVGNAPPVATNRVLQRFAPALAPYLVLGDPIALDVVAKFASGWKFTEVAARVRGGRLDSRGVKITSTRGRIEIDRQGNFLASDAELGAGENSARGTYWMNFSSRDFRILLTGRLRPADITGWFRSDWWPNFWRDFDFRAAPPRADVEVVGNYRDGARTVYFGRADATKAVVFGGDFETAHSVLFFRPHFQHLLAFAASRAAGAERASGSFKRFTDPVTKTTKRLEFSGEANFNPTVYQRMARGSVDSLLAPWEFTTPPHLIFHGHRTGSAPSAVLDLAFTGRVKSPARYYGFPIEGARVVGGVTGRDVRLDEIEVQVAGGVGRGKASLSGSAEARQLGFDAYVKDADLARSIRAVEEYEARRIGAAGKTTPDSKFMKRAAGGKLELSLSALGEPGSLESFRGSGNAQLTGAELGEIHLFGLLSQVLSAVSLDFSSLKLDTARSNFRLADGRINFPNLKVSGPSAVIDAKGDYVLASKSLDFLARLKPYEESRNPLKAAIGIVLNPLTSILELKLTGPLSKPAWSLALGSGNQPRPAPVQGPSEAVADKAPEATPPRPKN